MLWVVGGGLSSRRFGTKSIDYATVIKCSERTNELECRKVSSQG